LNTFTPPPPVYPHVCRVIGEGIQGRRAPISESIRNADASKRTTPIGATKLRNPEEEDFATLWLTPFEKYRYINVAYQNPSGCHFEVKWN